MIAAFAITCDSRKCGMALKAHIVGLVSSVDIETRTFDRRVLGSCLIRGSWLCPWARYFIHIAQQLKTEMLRINMWRWIYKQSTTHEPIQMYALERVNTQKRKKALKLLNNNKILNKASSAHLISMALFAFHFLTGIDKFMVRWPACISMLT